MELVELNNTELQFVNGGNFAYDAGWFLHYLGDTIAGSGINYDMGSDLASYYLHYSK